MSTKLEQLKKDYKDKIETTRQEILALVVMQNDVTDDFDRLIALAEEIEKELHQTLNDIN